MLDEISAAVLFLVRLIEKSENFNQEQLQDFKTRLSELLVERFKNHWFPETPFRGQGYRCIRVNERDRRDATLERAAIACGLKYEDLKLPVELTLWVDPNEVCCRFGEHRGSYCTLASFNGKENLVNMELLEKMGTVENESRKEMLQLNFHPWKCCANHTASPPHVNSSSVVPQDSLALVFGGGNRTLSPIWVPGDSICSKREISGAPNHSFCVSLCSTPTFPHTPPFTCFTNS
ncbi:protein BTG1-like isoform X2 [Schistocerca piceifrons]|uniref:protein BTG1-like isoform X2 n=1 Tax=Schistocerca piceifrons TaxID=274613 RepID=UPI001F5F8E57|nr:protein BTG1-like isoform X2 [Schistocerca piceifrons]